MTVRTLVTGALVMLAIAAVIYVVIDSSNGSDGGNGSDGSVTATDGLPDDGVVVYYFHGTKRCQTCNRMEALADAVIADRFARRREDGTVVFRSVNLETDATRHFVADFDLTNRVVVMVPRRGGEDLPFRRLDAVWEKIADADLYQDYIAENLAACLDDLDRDAS